MSDSLAAKSPLAERLAFEADPYWVRDGGRDYVSEFGLGSEQVPALIALAIAEGRYDLPEDDLSFWCAVHAWRALGQLRAEAAIAPLIKLLHARDDDWIDTELPRVIAMIGTAALPAATEMLEEAKADEILRTRAADTIAAIAQAHPEARDGAIAAFVRWIERLEPTTPLLNAVVISGLGELQATETVPAIEKAYAAKVVDTVFMAWVELQEAMGLVPPGTFKRQPSYWGLPASTAAPSRTPPKPTKNKRKAAQMARRKNRKR